MLSDSLPYASFAFTGAADGDFRPEREGYDQARGALLGELGGARLVMVTQVHGATVVNAADADMSVQADGLISTHANTVIAVRVADCVPVLLSCPGGVAAIHAGWRGTAADIVRVGLKALCEATGCSPRQVSGVVGPCISGKVYAVGSDVVSALRVVAVGCDWLFDGATPRVALDVVNADILRAAGVSVRVIGACTVSDPGHWSHRRDGPSAGRQVGAIRWTG